MSTKAPEMLVRLPDKPRAGAGASFIVAAFLLVAVMSALAKASGGVPTTTIVFFQNAISLAVFLPWSLRHGSSGLTTHHLLLHLVRGIGGMLSQALMFIALRRMPLMNAVLLSNSAPLFIPMVALIWLKQRVSIATWVSLAVGFVGIILILKPGMALLHDPADAVAVAAAACSAIALVTVNKLSTTEPTSRILFYYFLTATLLSAPFLPFDWRMPTGTQWACLGGVGACMAASQLLIILAYHYAKPSAIAPFNYSVVVFSGLIDWLFWGNVPGWLALAGVALVTVGGVLSTISAGHNARGHHGWFGHWNLPFRHHHSQPAGGTS